MADNVLLERKGRIATVTLSRPDRRNSLSDEMLGDLVTAFSALRDDDSTRVVIVTGAPPIFSAGADAPFKKGMSEEERRRMFTSRKSQFRRLFERANVLLENLEQVTIGAINGHAVGGGWGLALACDFRIAAAAAEFWIPGVGLVPPPRARAGGPPGGEPGGRRPGLRGAAGRQALPTHGRDEGAHQRPRAH